MESHAEAPQLQSPVMPGAKRCALHQVTTGQTLAKMVTESRSIGREAVRPRKLQFELGFCRRLFGGEVITSRRNFMFGWPLTARTMSCCMPHGGSPASV